MVASAYIKARSGNASNNKVGRRNKSFLDEEALTDEIYEAMVAACFSSESSDSVVLQDGSSNDVKLRAKAVSHAQNIVKKCFQHEAKFVHRELLDKYSAAQKADGSVVRVPMSATLSRHKGAEAIIPVDSEFSLESHYKHMLPRGVSSALQGWCALSSKIVHIMESSDYVTTKLLIELNSGQQVEAVLLRHNKRTTLCVSSQVGCKMGCTFCATGTLGQRANLTSGEIQEQLFHANRFLKTAGEPRDVTNIVFMGMGEPLNNYTALVAACRAMTSSARFCLSPGKVTVSTVGVTNRMHTLHRDVPGVSLALSLHAPNQELRQKIIPTASAYPVEKLMEALQGYLQERQTANPSREAYVMIEYILLSGVNDMVEVAEELAQLLLPIKRQVKVNLIPYNPIFNAEGLAKTFVPPTEEDILAFKHTIQVKHGIFCTVRTEMGQDVNGACGQLACVSEEAKGLAMDIEDLYVNRTQNKLYDEATGENVMRPNMKKSKQRKAKIAELKLKVEEAKAEVEHQQQQKQREMQSRLNKKKAKMKEGKCQPAGIIQKTLPDWAPAAAAVTVVTAATIVVASVAAALLRTRR